MKNKYINKLIRGTIILTIGTTGAFGLLHFIKKIKKNKK